MHLGIEGVLHNGGIGIDNDGELVDQGIMLRIQIQVRFLPLLHTYGVPMKVYPKLLTSRPLEIMGTRHEFRTNLLVAVCEEDLNQNLAKLRSTTLCREDV